MRAIIDDFLTPTGVVAICTLATTLLTLWRACETAKRSKRIEQKIDGNT